MVKLLNKIVLFDIDYTLFDTESLRKKMYQSIFSKTGYTINDHKTVLQKMYDELIDEYGYFSPRLFLKRIAKLLPSEVDAIEKAIWDRANFQDNFYEETREVVEQLSKEVLIGIFSKGYSKKWQKTKLSEIKHLFTKDHIYITLDKHITLPKLIKKYKGKKLYLVDDALDVLHTAKRLDKQIFTIWVKRGRYAAVQKPILGFVPDATVRKLRGIVKLVKES